MAGAGRPSPGPNLPPPILGYKERPRGLVDGCGWLVVGGGGGGGDWALGRAPHPEPNDPHLDPMGVGRLRR